MRAASPISCAPAVSSAAVHFADFRGAHRAAASSSGGVPHRRATVGRGGGKGNASTISATSVPPVVENPSSAGRPSHAIASFRIDQCAVRWPRAPARHIPPEPPLRFRTVRSGSSRLRQAQESLGRQRSGDEPPASVAWSTPSRAPRQRVVDLLRPRSAGAIAPTTRARRARARWWVASRPARLNIAFESRPATANPKAAGLESVVTRACHVIVAPTIVLAVDRRNPYDGS